MTREKDGQSPAAPGAAVAGRWKALGVVVLAFFASRLLVFGVAKMSRLEIIPGPLWEPGGLVTVLSGGEAGVHLRAAGSAEWFGAAAGGGELGFFPLFPALVKLAAFLLQDVALGGIAVANVALLVAGFLLYQLVFFELGDERASRAAVMLMMFAPAGVFFSSALPDSTVLAFAIAALLAARKMRWPLAALFAIAAAATSSHGLWVVVPLFVESLLQRRGVPLGERLQGRVAPILVATGGGVVILTLLAIGYSRLDDPLALFRTGAQWQRGFEALVQRSLTFAGYRVFYANLFWSTLAAAAAICAGGFFLRVRLSYLAFAVALVVACLWSYDMQAIRRLGLAFPLFIVMARWSMRQEPAYPLFVTVSMSLLAACTLLVANGFWIASD